MGLLTDGREWAFYLPAGQGSYEERRVYRLQLDERAPGDAAARLHRYLARDRVQSGQAQEDAGRDYRDVHARREAVRVLPRAWAELTAKGEDLLLELVADEAEQLCGARPPAEDVLLFLRALGGGAPPEPGPATRARPEPVRAPSREAAPPGPGAHLSPAPGRQAPPLKFAYPRRPPSVPRRSRDAIRSTLRPSRCSRGGCCRRGP